MLPLNQNVGIKIYFKTVSTFIPTRISTTLNTGRKRPSTSLRGNYQTALAEGVMLMSAKSFARYL